MTAGTAISGTTGGRSGRNTYELLSALTWRDLRLRYQGSFFGWTWSLARPVALGVVLYFALGKVLGAGIEDYPQFLLVGLFPWFWFQASLQQSTTSFVGNGGLLKKVRFPRIVLPLSVVTGNTLQFLLAAPVVVVFLLVAGRNPTWEWLVGVPILFAIQLLLIIGIATFLASATVFFRDLEHITEVLLGLLFYATPILYDVDRVPEGYEWTTKVNPLAPIMEGWRDVLMDGNLPSWGLGISAAAGVVATVLGLWLFNRTQDAFADVV